MRLLHTSDWHLGQRLINQDRSLEHEAALDFILETIDRERVDVLVIAGDIFDTASPSSAAQTLYFNFLTRLLKTSLKATLVIGGNHDSPALLNAPAALLNHLNIHIIGKAKDKIESQLIEVKQGDELLCVFAAVPFLRDKDFRVEKTMETAHDRVDRIKQGILHHYTSLGEYAKKYTNTPVIATGHLYVQNAQAQEARENIYLGDTQNIKANAFPNSFDYVALGHIHRLQQIDNENVWYSGSIIPMSFSERSDTKGMLLVDFDQKQVVSTQILSIPQTRRLKSLSVNRENFKEKLDVFNIRHQEEEKAWIEIVLEEEYISSQFQAQIYQYIEDKELNLQVLKITKKKNKHNIFTEEVADRIENYTPQQIFAMKCEAEQIPKEKVKTLNMALNEIIEQINTPQNEDS